MDRTDLLIDQARTGDLSTTVAGNGHAVALASVCAALDRGGLSYALDWHRPAAVADAVAACRYFGLPQLAELLHTVVAAAAARGRVSSGLVADFDARYGDYADRWRDFRDALATRLADDPNAFALTEPRR